jgi:hypothetical protein
MLLGDRIAGRGIWGDGQTATMKKIVFLLSIPEVAG